MVIWLAGLGGSMEQITKKAWTELEIERQACLMAAEEMRKNDGYHMGGKNYREIIDLFENRAAIIQKAMGNLMVIENEISQKQNQERARDDKGIG